MKLIRTFYPVGQGAFYSEKHIFRGKEFNIVYDCGSTTLDRNQMESKIKSALPENFEIDILFISHFHADHINGIEFLKEHTKIKKVIIPFLDKYAKILVKNFNYLDDNQTNTQIVDDPSRYFGENITVIEINESEENAPEVNVEEPINSVNIVSGRSIPSGSVLISGVQDHEWYFIPFNFRHSEARIEFEKALLEVNLKLSDIESIDQMILHKNKIRKAFKKVKGDLNQNSLVLFSGRLEERRRLRTFYQHYMLDNYSFPKYRFHVKDGCLYSGDICLKNNNVIPDLCRSLNPFLSNIGIVQIPHHGSIHNYSEKIFEKINAENAVISFGTKNLYNHPSDCTIEKIISDSVFPLSVTEEQKSLVVQF